MWVGNSLVRNVFIFEKMFDVKKLSGKLSYSIDVLVRFSDVYVKVIIIELIVNRMKFGLWLRWLVRYVFVR